jgi:hypothetical protein
MQSVISPIIARLGRRTGKGPEPHTFVFDSSQVGKAPDRSVWIELQSFTTVE